MASEAQEKAIMKARMAAGDLGPNPIGTVVPGDGTNTHLRTFTKPGGPKYSPGQFQRTQAHRAIIVTRNGDGRISDSYGVPREPGRFKNGQHGDAKNIKPDHTVKVG